MLLTQRDLYHIEFERSENISNLRSKYIEQPSGCISTKNRISPILKEVNNMSENLENLPNNEENNEEVMKIEIDSITEENDNGEVIEILDKEPKKKKSAIKEIFDWVVSIASAIAIVLLLHIFVFVQVTVSGSSMDPTLKDKDRLIAVRFMYEPKYADIVVVDPYLSEGTVKGKTMFNRVLYIKRVIATGGQTIDLKDGKVYIDGKLLEEDYIADSVKTYTQSTEMPVTVPEGCVFVMGDNREWSKDSRDRTVGILRNEQVVGKAVFRLLPFDKFGVVK